MGGWWSNRRRKLAGAFALLGILLYSGLFPGHIASQAASDLLKAQYGEALDHLCQADAAGAKTADGGPASEADCPFCQGLAAFQFAGLTPPPLEGLLEQTFAASYQHTDEDLQTRSPRAPQSRGPPGTLT
jgi:hypothetical protein